MAASSSGVPTSRKGSTYDVFLSFRGADTRYNFVGYLYEALQRAGIHVFKDDRMLGGGESISEELVKAIKESRWAVVVFSKHYATSSWCLDELFYIMECHKQLGQEVLPVFYHVDPSDVRWQKKDFATALKTHEDRFKGGDQMDKVNKWRDALTAAANLSGKHIVPDKDEVDFVNEIVQQISADIKPLGGSKESHLIGIQPRINTLISLLKMDEKTEKVRIVGIWGMGGIGKTTLARALFKRIAHKFEAWSFVADVRENSSSKKDMCTLQETILNDILGERHGYKIKDRDQGAETIEERCCRKKVLLVIDDVNDFEQLEFLAATREWFGPGSRIIITTRDQRLLEYVDETYKPALLISDQAVELFSRHAFNERSPPEGYEELSIRAIHHAGGLPLALKVLGSHFCGLIVDLWESALKRLDKTPDDNINKVLKLSFDNLSDADKKIFLDIACFYKGEDVDDVTRILDSLDCQTKLGIKFLVQKSLLNISAVNRLDMHDLVQEMGRKEAQDSSRIWKLEQIHDSINKQKLKVIEGIVLPWNECKESLSADVFESTENLRVLDCYGNLTSCEPRFLPHELRWFCWREYPFSSVPLAHMSKLVGLEMEEGKIKHLWQGKKIKLHNLKFINLRSCGSLTRFPDVSGTPNIESLDLSGCFDLVEVDESVVSLKKLRYLDMSGCYELKCLPSMLQMESLETLILSDCGSLERIPEFSQCMINVSKLDINGCVKIKEVPSSIKYLSNLKELDVSHCESLESIPNSIWKLKCLHTLRLNKCEKLKLQHDFQSMESLEVLHIDSIHIHALANSCYSRKLHLHGDLGDNDFPKNLHGLSSLVELHIRENHKLIQLPESISHLSSLKLLLIEDCDRLETLLGLPPGIQVLDVKRCNSLEKIEDLSKEYEYLNKIRISRSPKLLEDEENGRNFDKLLDQSFLTKWAAFDGGLTMVIPGSNIPSWFKEQEDGCKITLKLPPKWQTEIIGFAICCVSRTQYIFPDINLSFENDEMLVSKSEANNNGTLQVGQYLSTGYIPFSLFKQFRGCSDNDFEGGDWFHMTKGNLVFTISGHLTDNVIRCGAKVVYKEDVTSIQETIPLYWRWKLTNSFTNSFECSQEARK